MKINLNIEGTTREYNFKNYTEMVAFLAKHQINYEFPNGVIAHTKDIVKSFAKYMNGIFKIYTVDLSAAVFDDKWLLDELRYFLTRNSNNKLSVIVQNTELLTKKRGFYTVLQEFFNTPQIEFKHYTKGKGGRFMTLQNAFRMETQRTSKENFCALVNFSDEKYSNTLDKYFHTAYQAANTTYFK